MYFSALRGGNCCIFCRCAGVNYPKTPRGVGVWYNWYNWYLLVRLNARAGPSNCTKKARDFRVPGEKGKKHKTKQKVGREYNHRTHKSLTFRLFGHSQRSTAIHQVSAGTFIAIREGDPPQLPHVHKVPQAKSFIFFPTHRPHSTPKHIQRSHCKQKNNETIFGASTLPSSNQIPRLFNSCGQMRVV